MRSTILKSLSDSGIYVAALILTSMAAFISVPIYTRLFDPHEYGYLALAIATLSVLNVFASGAVSSAVIRFLPRFHQSKSEGEFYVSSFLTNSVFTLIVAVSSLLIVYFMRSFLSVTLYKLLIMVPVVLVAASSFDFFLSLLRARQDSIRYAILLVANRFLSLFVGLFLVLVLHKGVFGVLLGIFLTHLLLDAAILALVLRRQLDFHKFKLVTAIVRKIAVYGLPLIFSLLAHWILSTSDRYILQFLRGGVEVGVYSISYDLSFKSMSLVTAPFITALTPAIVRIWEHNRKEAADILKRLSLFYFMFCLPALAGFNALAHQIIRVFATPPYFSGQAVFPFISTGIIFMGMYSISYTGLLVYEKSGVIAKTLLFCAFTNVVLNFLLIPSYGFLGAGISTLLAYFAAFVIASLLSSKYLQWQPDSKGFMKILLSSILMGVIVHVLSNVIFDTSVLSLIIEISIGISVYLFLLHVLRVIHIREVKRFFLEARFLIFPSG